MKLHDTRDKVLILCMDGPNERQSPVTQATYAIEEENVNPEETWDHLAVSLLWFRDIVRMEVRRHLDQR